jgi:hypothetical protein
MGTLDTLCFVIVAATSFKLESVGFGSKTVNIAILLGVFVAVRVIYQLILYPQYFTPLKHIQTPAVSGLCLLV